MATITSAASSEASATLTVTDWWLKDPTDADLNAAIDVQPPHPVRIRKRTGVFRALGRSKSLTVSGVAGAQDGSVTVMTATAAEWDALEALVSSTNVLLLQSPLGDQWYVTLADDVEADLTFAAGEPWRSVRFSYVEVDAP